MSIGRIFRVEAVIRPKIILATLNLGLADVGPREERQ